MLLGQKKPKQTKVNMLHLPTEKQRIEQKVLSLPIYILQASARDEGAAT